MAGTSPAMTTSDSIESKHAVGPHVTRAASMLRCRPVAFAGACRLLQRLRLLWRPLSTLPSKAHIAERDRESAAKGGHHKLLNPHSFRGMEFNDGDERN